MQAAEACNETLTPSARRNPRWVAQMKLAEKWGVEWQRRCWDQNSSLILLQEQKSLLV